MKALKLIRECLDLTQVEAAELVGVSQSYLCEIEAGRKKPSFELLQKYAVIIQLPMSALFFLLERVDNDDVDVSVQFGTEDRYIVKTIMKWAVRRQEADKLRKEADALRRSKV